MKKLDEIMELLTEEIDGFNKSITKLERLSEKIRHTRINADTSGIETMVENYLHREESTLTYYKSQMGEINKKLRWGRALLLLFCITTTITVLTMGYFGYQNILLEREKEDYYNQGRKETMEQFQGFFDGHPEAYKSYELWIQKKKGVSDKK